MDKSHGIFCREAYPTAQMTMTIVRNAPAFIFSKLFWQREKRILRTLKLLMRHFFSVIFVVFVSLLQKENFFPGEQNDLCRTLSQLKVTSSMDGELVSFYSFVMNMFDPCLGTIRNIAKGTRMFAPTSTNTHWANAFSTYSSLTLPGLRLSL